MADDTQSPGFWQSAVNAFRGTPLPEAPAPPPPSTVTLSDGRTMAFDDPNTPQDQRDAAISAAEAHIDQQHIATAKTNNAPFTPVFTGPDGKPQEGTKTYSSERSYSNNYSGKAQAYLDHTTVGSSVNQFLNPKLAAAAPYAQPVARVATNVVAAGPDMWGSGVNMLRHTLGNEQEKQVPDIPSFGAYLRKQAGIPELSPDAPAWQRYGEGAASAILSGGASGAVRAVAERELPTLASAAGQTLKSGAQGVASQGASDVGGALFGEPGAYVGGLLGGAVPYGKIAAAGLGRSFATRNAGDILQAGEALRTPEDPNFTPSFRSMANPTGQRIAAVLGSIPVSGHPIEAANEATRAKIMNVRDTAAENIAGGPMPPQGASPESMGGALTAGAQAGILNANQREAQAWEPLHAMGAHPTDIAPVVAGTNTMLQGNRTTPQFAQPVRESVAGLGSMAPGGPEYDPSRGPVPPLPQPTMDVPFSAVKDYRTGLNYGLNTGTGDIRVPGNLTANVRDLTTTAMRNAAAQAGRLPEFETASAVTQQVNPIREALTRVGGKPIGDTGQFEDVPGESSAYNRAIGSNLQSPSTMEPILSNMPFENRRVAAGQYISRLGTTKQGDFRPEDFYHQWQQATGEGARDLLTQGPSGGPSAELRNLHNAATVAQNFSTPTSRHGLMSSLGAARAVDLLLHGAGAAGGAMLGGIPGAVIGAAVPPSLVYGASRGLESPAMKTAMAGRSLIPAIGQSVYSALPKVAAVQEQEDTRRRLLAAAGRPAY